MRAVVSKWLIGWMVACAGCSSSEADSTNNYANSSDGSFVDSSSDSADASPAVDAAVDATGDTSVDTVPDTAQDHAASDSPSEDSLLDTTVDAEQDTPPDAPPWIVGNQATCPELAPLRDTSTDASSILQMCIDRTPDGMTLVLDPGRYSLAAQLHLDREIGLSTTGRIGTASCSTEPTHGCAELFALPAFDTRLGMFLATGAVTIDHIVLHGNRQGRSGTHAHQMCSALTDNAYGYNATLQCSNCRMTHSVSMYALCGTGLQVIAPAVNVTISHNTFAFNGLHTTKNMWSDGLTVHDSEKGVYEHNTFIDNTDIDLIFGGCKKCKIRYNQVHHTSDPAGGAFAAIMIQKWPTTSGCYEDVDISGNAVDCGPLRACGSAFYIGSESWYPETPYGTLQNGTTSGLIKGNSVNRAMNAFYIAARGLAIYGNDFLQAHGVPIPNSCHKNIVSTTPIVVSPTAASCHFNFENVDPGMSIHYSSASWAGCVPNYPF
jgi:hypothetical protein